MSVGFLGSKHTVFDIYPLRQKKVFLLVDPQNLLGDTADFHATLDTITYLLRKKSIIIIAASFGAISGITLNLSKKEREGAIEAFQREGGMGYTNFFSNLPPAVKLDVLNSISGLELTRDLGKSSPNTGKTTLFASLSTETKEKALEGFFKKREFMPCTTGVFVSALESRFPGVKVHFSPDCVRAPLHNVAPGEIMVLENMRFYRNEMSPLQEERQAMAEVIASDVDIFINDSFRTACNELASNVELPRLLQHGAAGQSMDRELAFYSKFLNHPGRPLAVVIAGSHIARKLQLVRSLIGRADRIFVAGATAYPFLAAKGLSCGLGYPLDAEPTISVPGRVGAPGSGRRHRKRSSNTHSAAAGAAVGAASAAPNGTGSDRRRRQSSCGSGHGGAPQDVLDDVIASPAPGLNIDAKYRDDEYLDEVPCSVYAREILDLCKQYDVEIILPIDHYVTTDPDGERGRAVLVESTAIPSDVYSMDCGPNTINLFERSLRDCRTVFWTGSMGWASKGYTSGTSAFAEMLGRANIISIVGGRFTAQVVHEAGVADRVLHVSSGGISSLQVLQGNPLPGLQALSDVAPQSDVSSVSINELVRKLPMFIGCNSHQLKVIAKKFVRRVLNKGDYILYRGDRHVCLTLVAHGGLVARCAEEYTSAPARFIPSGQTASTYSFITQAPAMETIRAAQDDTVVYQLFSSALNELLNAHPDLAAQLFQNLSEPLRVIANEDYRKQQSVSMVVRRNACRTRVPVLATIPAGSGAREDMLQDILSTLALQHLTMRFTPYVAALNVELPPELLAPPPGPVGRAFAAVCAHDGLPMALASSVVRTVVYHQVIDLVPQPWMAAVVSGALTAPLRLLAYGIKYNDINFKLMLDEGLIDAAAALAPVFAYRIALEVQQKVERSRKRRMTALGRAAVMSVVKLLVGILVFPVVYQRNFVYTQPSASRFWERSAFHAYQLKQVLSLFLRYVVHRSLKLIAM